MELVEQVMGSPALETYMLELLDDETKPTELLHVCAHLFSSFLKTPLRERHWNRWFASNFSKGEN